MPNVQITHSKAHHAHDDVAAAVDPNDSSRLIAASEHQPNVAEELCHIDVRYSTTSGATWSTSASLALPPGATGTINPSVAWDSTGQAYLAVAATTRSSGGSGTGIWVYTSSDGGAHWSAPVAVAAGDDFPALAADPFTGTVYLAARRGIGNLKISTSTDHGGSWSAPYQLVDSHYEVSRPSIAVGGAHSPAKSTVLVVWGSDGAVIAAHSSDGGLSFTSPSTINQGLGTDQLATPSCAARGRTFAVACTNQLPANRQIWLKFSIEQGVEALFTPAGREAVIERNGEECFNPRLACAGLGIVGCAFYRRESIDSTPLIDVDFEVVSDDKRPSETVTDVPWDPAKGGFTSGGSADTTFLEEPFALLASDDNHWHAVWPDTRTGRRQLWTMIFESPHPPLGAEHLFESYARVLFGVIQDGGGVIDPGGHVPPYGPPDGMLVGAVAYLLADKIGGGRGARHRLAALKAIARGANAELARAGMKRSELLALLPHG
jgi:hypothetical protein